MTEKQFVIIIRISILYNAILNLKKNLQYLKVLLLQICLSQ